MDREDRPLVVTLDGPAGTGKSSVARALASRLGVAFLDTGAMYRAMAVRCLDEGIDPALDADAVAELAQRASLQFDWATDPPELYADGHNVTERIRDADASTAASQVAVFPPVRQALVDAQRRIGQERRQLVSEGRDQGSVVFPDADVKFYLDAVPWVRADRRLRQLRQAGKDVDEQEILDEIVERDSRDAGRTCGPLVCPDDAVRIDTSDLTEQEVVDLLERFVRERTGLQT